MHAMAQNQDRRPATAMLRDWWRRWTSRLNARRELDNCDPADMARLAGDIGVSSNELRALADHGAADADLLYRRMELLHIDRGELARTDPATLRDLQRLCTFCQSHGRCGRDLADADADPAWQEWRDYCPNATTLTVMSTVEGCRDAPVR